jgi:hypothetical protein
MKKQLRYIVQPGNVGTFQLYNTRNQTLLGGIGFRTAVEAFESCDMWNAVPPGTSARAQQLAPADNIRPATRLMTICSEMHHLSQALSEEASMRDPEVFSRYKQQYQEYATEYVGLMAADIAEKLDVAEKQRRGKTAIVAGEDFTLTISTETGRILASSSFTDAAAQRIEQIDRFDIRDAAEWTERWSGSESIANQSFALPAIGYWDKGKNYQAPDEEFRAEVAAEHGVFASARP